MAYKAKNYDSVKCNTSFLLDTETFTLEVRTSPAWPLFMIGSYFLDVPR